MNALRSILAKIKEIFRSMAKNPKAESFCHRTKDISAKVSRDPRLRSFSERSINFFRQAKDRMERHPRITLGVVALVATVLLFFRPGDIDMAKVHEFDRIASDPEDSGRVAPGVSARNILPARALPVGEKAVSDHPKHPRLRYQLARVYDVQGDHEKAFEAYQHAADLGYPIARIRLAEAYAKGSGVEQDLEVARILFLRAIEDGSELAGTKLDRYFFRADGFLFEEDFSALYRGEFDEIELPKGEMLMHLTAFIQSMQGEFGSPQILSNAGVIAASQKSAGAVFGQILGMIAGERRSYPQSSGRIDYGRAFGQGMAEAQKVQGRLLDQSQGARDDAALFSSRFGHDSPVAKRMFTQIDRYVRNLEGVGFMSELERNMYNR